MTGGQCIRDVCKADKRRHGVQGWAALLPGTLSHPESVQERDLFHGFPTRRHQLGHQTHLDPRSSLSSPQPGHCGLHGISEPWVIHLYNGKVTAAF